MSYSKYQCSVPTKNYIRALISRIPLSDTKMDYLKGRSSDLRVYCIDILELINFESLWCIIGDVLTSDFKVPFWVTAEVCSQGTRTVC